MDHRAKRPRADSLDEPDLYWKAIKPVWDQVKIYWSPKEYLEALAPFAEPQQLLFAAHWCQAEVMSGGLYQFFSNDPGVAAPEAVRGLELVGMRPAARVVAKAMGHFGRKYPRSRKQRLDRLAGASGDDNRFEALDQRLYGGSADLNQFLDRANAFVRAHLDQFFKPGAERAEVPLKRNRQAPTQWHALPRSAGAQRLRSVTIDSARALREFCATESFSSVDEIVLSEGLSKRTANILGATTGPKIKKLSFHVAWNRLDTVVRMLKGHPLCGRVDLLSFDMYAYMGEPAGELFKALKRLKPLPALTMACATGRIEEGRRTAEVDATDPRDAADMIGKLPKRLDDITVRIDRAHPGEPIDGARLIRAIGERKPAHAHVPAAWLRAAT